MEDQLLSFILDFKMTKQEAKAWKIAILYLGLIKKNFPNYNKYRLPKGDPRKSALFRYCYKLLRETEDKLPFSQYREYIQAQLQVLKNIQKENYHALIEPNCLVGPQAWKRWLLWQKKLDNSIKYSKASEIANCTSDDIKKELDATKEFLVRKLKTLTEETMRSAVEGRAIFRWCVLKQVSPYFLVLSPLVKEWVEKTGTNLLELFVIDLSLYKDKVTQEDKDYFKKLFGEIK